jgi:hypothetical protein
MKEFIVKENAAFRLRVKSRKCLRPADLNSIEFIQETLKDGNVADSSTYNFFMSDEELKALGKELSNVTIS